MKEAPGSSDPERSPPSVFRFCLFGLDGVLDLHVVKFFGVKDLATLQALDKLGVIVPGDNTHSWVFADRCHRFRVVGFGCFCHRCIMNPPQTRDES